MRAVVFDLDGVLVDTPATIADLLVEVLVEQGCRPARQALLDTVGRPLEASLAGLLGCAVGDARVARAVDRYRERFLGVVAARGTALLYPGVVEGLGRLAAAGLPLGVGTSKPAPIAAAVLDASGIADRFAAVVGVDMVARGKPEPDTGLLAAGKLGVPPDECGYVGDALGDVAMARTAGMQPVAVSYGVATAGELTTAGAGVVCASFPDVVDHVLGRVTPAAPGRRPRR